MTASRYYLKNQGRLVTRQQLREELARDTSESSELMSLLFKTDTVSGRLNLVGLDRPADSFLWIYLGMMARAESISKVPLRISDDQDNLYEDGDLANLLTDPNPYMDGVQYLHLIECHLSIFNRALVAMVSAQGGRPDELIPLYPPACKVIRATHVPTGTKIPVGWEYRDPETANLIRFTWNEVIPIQSYSPHALHEPVNPMNVGRRSMQADMAAREQNLAIFLNGGMPDIVFETDQTWTRDQGEEFMGRWQDRYGGVLNAHKPGLLYGGLKAKALGLSPTELQFLEGLRLSRDEQVALMRVKPAMVGLMTGETGLSQGSSTDAQKVAWWNETGLYELARIAAAHQSFLVTPFDWRSGRRVTRLGRDDAMDRRRFIDRMVGAMSVTERARMGGMQIWFDEGSIEELSEHRRGRLAQMKDLLAMGYTPDDANDYLDLRLPPHPTNLATLPMGVQPAGDLVLRDEGAGRDEGGKLKAEGEEVGRNVEEGLGRIEELLRDEGRTRRRRWMGAHRRFQGTIKEKERQFAKRMARFYIEQRGRILARLAEARKAVERDEPERGGVPLDRLFPRAEEDAFLLARMTALWVDLVETGWNMTREEVGLNADQNPFEVADTRVQAAIERRKIQGTRVNDTTEEALREILAKNVEEGGTLDDLAESIAGYYRDNAAGETKARPKTAARTQVSGVVNDGRLAAAESVGGLRKAWLHGAPEEAREHHVAAEAKYMANPIPLEELFELPETGVRMKAPGDADAPIGETANCTCMLVFV